MRLVKSEKYLLVWTGIKLLMLKCLKGCQMTPKKTFTSICFELLWIDKTLSDKNDLTYEWAMMVLYLSSLFSLWFDTDKDSESLHHLCEFARIWLTLVLHLKHQTHGQTLLHEHRDTDRIRTDLMSTEDRTELPVRLCAGTFNLEASR